MGPDSKKINIEEEFRNNRLCRCEHSRSFHFINWKFSPVVHDDWLEMCGVGFCQCKNYQTMTNLEFLRMTGKEIIV